MDANWNFDRPLLDADRAALLESAVLSGDVRGVLARLEFEHPGYLRVKDLLARYRDIEANRGWPRVPEGATLRPGASLRSPFAGDGRSSTFRFADHL